jgi:hypothetical protein
MTKLCPRGKAAAKRKFKVYPSAYANAYASKICAGKIKDPSGVKRKDFRGPKPSKAMGGRIYKAEGGVSLQERATERKKLIEKSKPAREKIGVTRPGPQPKTKTKVDPRIHQRKKPKMKGSAIEGNMKMMKKRADELKSRKPMMGGGMTMMPRAMYKKGGKSFPDLSGDGKVTMKDILMGRGVIPRKGKKGGGLMEATSRLRAQGLKKGGVAKGCGAVMNDRRKVTKMY